MALNRLTSLVTVALLGTCVLNACYQAKTPDQVAKDTAAAENTAAENTAKVAQAADDKVNSAQGVVNDQKATEAHTQAVEEERVADAKAEGNHKVALAQCESLSGEGQKACRDQADTALTVEKDRAKLAKANSDPKP